MNTLILPPKIAFMLTCATNDNCGTGLVSVDWYSLSCVLVRPWVDEYLRPNPRFRYAKQSHTNLWEERWYIHDLDGNKIATILAVPRSWKIAPNRAVIEVANRWLYHDNFLHIVDEVLDACPCVVEGLVRVDLCCDFEMSVGWYDTYLRLARKTAYAGAYKDSVVWWSALNGDDVPHQISWGGVGSALHWKIYYKYKEITDADEAHRKQYILDAWDAVGLRQQYVWRCEVSLQGSNNLRAAGSQDKIPPTDWYVRRADLWQSLYTTRFVIRAKEGHKDKRNDARLPFLEVAKLRLLQTAPRGGGLLESDPERRLLAKLWDEYMSADVAANEQLHDMLRDNILRLVERPANWYALLRISTLDTDTLCNALLPLNVPTA